MAALGARLDAHARADGVGVGLRARHYRDFLEERPAVPWLEVHTENFLDEGGWDSHVLTTLRKDYPISLHGVGLGLGSLNGFSEAHMARVHAVVRRLEPCFVSEHLCWTATAHARLPDLLPLALDRFMLDLLCERIDRVQSSLGRRLLVENVSTYLRFHADAMSEAECLSELVRRTGCGLLLDVNNLYVNQRNHAEDALRAMAALPPGSVEEIHLAGHLETGQAVIDHHGAAVAPEVWALYRAALRRFGPVPTLIEWDTDVPALDVLLGEAGKAAAIMREPAPVESGPAAGAAGHAPRIERIGSGAAAVPGTNAGPATALSAREADRPTAMMADLQSRFAQALADGDADGAGTLGVHPRSGLSLYRGNVNAAWERALASAFPVLRQLVGDEYFSGLARAYGRAVPMDDPDLNRFGAGLADFLTDFPGAAAYPYFPAMARLEWHIHRSHYASAPPRLTREALARLAPAQLDGLVLSLHPTVALFDSDWQVVSLWRAHQPSAEQDFPAEMAGREWALVARPAWHAFARAISRGEWSLLTAIQRGGSFGAAIEAALHADPEFDLAGSLQRILDLGVLNAPEWTVPLDA